MVLIKGLQKTTVVDYPGKVACTVFLAGCNFRCPFCHNPDLIEKKGYDNIKTIDEKYFLEFLDTRKKWIDGVVITGGEPCIHNDLHEFIAKIKEKGFLVKLDTNGTNPDMIGRLIDRKLVDYIAMDIKSSMDNYSKAVGIDIDNDKIKKSIELIKEAGTMGLDYEFRTTVVPEIHSKEDVQKIGNLLKGSHKIAVQQFNSTRTYDPKYVDVKPFSKQEIDEFKNILDPCIDEVEIRL